MTIRCEGSDGPVVHTVPVSPGQETSVKDATIARECQK